MARPAWLSRGLLVAAALVATSPAAASEGIWLDLSAPQANAVHVGPTDLLEVRGRAGSGTGGRRDLVIVLDVSGSTWVASGSDVDGDGKLGRTPRRVQRAMQGHPGAPHSLRGSRPCSDPGDSIRAAEITATRHLLDLLHPEWTRVGLVTFADTATVRAPVGSRREVVRDALDRLDLERPYVGGETNFHAALEAALSALEATTSAAPGEAVERAILFLSDGQPTAPLHRAEKRALEAAARVGDAGVRLHTFALGPDATEHAGVYAEMARVTGGTTAQVREAGAIVTQLARVDLADLTAISLENLTSGAPGRAVRVFPDGSFDGFVPLEPGENLLRVTALSRTGLATTLQRSVRFAPQQPASSDEAARHRQELEEFAEELHTRTVGTELLADLERAREEGQRKQLDLRAEGLPGVGAGPVPGR